MPAHGKLTRRRFAAGLLGAGLATRSHAQAAAPDTLPPWSPGHLDIHHLAVGRGNATLVIFPDGRSLLIDAGAVLNPTEVSVPTRPSGERRAGEWIARYAQRHLQATGRTGLDDLLVTHLHPDHLGDVAPDSPRSRHGNYQLGGVTDVAEMLNVRRIVDRGFPDYGAEPGPNSLAANLPRAPATGLDKAAFFRNYHAFINARGARGEAVERFTVGSDRQFPWGDDFRVRNLAANGEVWAGRGQPPRRLFPDAATLPAADAPNENMCSTAICIESGAFRYFTGGDLTSEDFSGEQPWRNVLLAAARAAGPVDVATADHHGLFDGLSADVVRALRPRAWVIQAWHVSHPSTQQLEYMLSERLYPGPRDVFATELMRENELINRRLVQRLRSQRGHVVVRVAPGGGSYRVFVTDNLSESDEVRYASMAHRSASAQP